eukprot:scaffold1883_cov396-Prasinococcus_capsulatus_cf.AAC.8
MRGRASVPAAAKPLPQGASRLITPGRRSATAIGRPNALPAWRSVGDADAAARPRPQLLQQQQQESVRARTAAAHAAQG